MKIVTIHVLFIALSCQCFSQNTHEAYVKSFPEVQRHGTIKFYAHFDKQKSMTRAEALKFVYSGDTAKLICISKDYDMVSEKMLGVSREERLPLKCMILNMGDYYLTCNLSYDCHNSEKPQVSYITLTTLNKKYKAIDSLIVYRRINEINALMGELNTSNGNIILIGDVKNSNTTHISQYGLKTVDASLLSIDSKTLKFKTLKESSNLKGYNGNFPKMLKILGWEEIFNGN